MIVILVSIDHALPLLALLFALSVVSSSAFYWQHTLLQFALDFVVTGIIGTLAGVVAVMMVAALLLLRLPLPLMMLLLLLLVVVVMIVAVTGFRLRTMLLWFLVVVVVIRASSRLPSSSTGSAYGMDMSQMLRTSSFLLLPLHLVIPM